MRDGAEQAKGSIAERCSPQMCLSDASEPSKGTRRHVCELARAAAPREKGEGVLRRRSVGAQREGCAWEGAKGAPGAREREGWRMLREVRVCGVRLHFMKPAARPNQCPAATTPSEHCI
jgi:hypothetical protein